ncbi:MAG TPA: hypothetical protein VF610_09125, partial [Segetibacter sp.]
MSLTCTANFNSAFFNRVNRFLLFSWSQLQASYYDIHISTNANSEAYIEPSTFSFKNHSFILLHQQALLFRS